MIITTMGTSEAQKLIALSLGKIAMSRQQRGGINLHKNLLVASVLHKARNTYMMDNFQTLIANKKAQAEKEAAAKMIVETPDVTSSNSSDNRLGGSMDVSVKTRGVTDCSRVNNSGAPSGERPEKRTESLVDKENVVPDNENNKLDSITTVEKSQKNCDQPIKKCVRDSRESSPVVTGKQPLSAHNGGPDYVNQTCRCAGGKRRRSFVDNESGTQPKKPRYEDEFENSDSECDVETKEHEKMQTETTQVTNLVNIFSSGFNGLLKEQNDSNQQKGQVNVYVSADRSVSSHHYVLAEVSCATQFKDSVTVPTAIALAV